MNKGNSKVDSSSRDNEGRRKQQRDASSSKDASSRKDASNGKDANCGKDSSSSKDASSRRMPADASNLHRKILSNILQEKFVIPTYNLNIVADLHCFLQFSCNVCVVFCPNVLYDIHP
jgi:hypothetical protein